MILREDILLSLMSQHISYTHRAPRERDITETRQERVSLRARQDRIGETAGG